MFPHLSERIILKDHNNKIKTHENGHVADNVAVLTQSTREPSWRRQTLNKSAKFQWLEKIKTWRLRSK
jgi:hypothetical protein